MESDSSCSSCGPGPSEGCQGRKMLRFEENWMRKKRKIRKDHGKSYQTYRGERKDPKEPPVTVLCRCYLNCSARVSTSERKQVFEDLYKLADHDSQNKYLYGLIERFSPKQRRPRNPGATQRGNSFCYFVRLSNGDCVRVCKHIFCQIHGIGK